MCELCAATSTFDPVRHPGEGPVAAVITETSDAPSTTATGYSINAGDTFVGSLTAGSDTYDVVAVTLTAGDSYEIALSGVGSGAGTLGDPYLSLLNSSGTQVGFNDDGGPGLDSLLSFTATYTGTYYLVASSFLQGSTGTYRMSVTEVAPPTPPSVASLDELANYLTDGYWNDTNRSGRAFDTSSDNVITVNLTGLTAAGQQLARWALEAWEMVANLDFQETGGSADITFDDNQSGAYASSVVSGGTILSSTINVSTSWISTYGTTMDSYSFQTYIHEIGHAIGLGHQGGYNGAATYGTDETYSNDSWQVSIMSYFSQTQNTTTSASYALLLTTMMADIVAAQNLYGAATTPTSGNTVWGAGSNLGNYLDTYFATLTGSPNSGVNGGSAIAYTVYDQGGVDTLNTSYSNNGDRINLNAASFSDVGGGIGNVGIARGTIIENATTGNGNDTIIGNWAGNIINSNGGNDTIDAGGGWDKIWAGDGADTVFGGNGNDTIGGMNGNDQLWGGNHNDRIFGGSGNDTIGGGSGNDQLFGDNDHDLVRGGDGNDTVRGGQGNDRLYGENNNDWMHGDNGSDTMYGGSGADTMYGGGWSDLVDGGSGNDQVFGDNGNDTLFGGNGNDTLGGGDHNDSINGGSQNDVLYGGNGNDTLVGGWGDDTMNGNGGNDRLIFGPGNDVGDGGWGADTFVFGTDIGGSNTVNNFLVSQGDRLSLDDALWTGSHGALSASQVLSTFGSNVGGNLVLTFSGGQSITLTGLGTATGLDSYIDIF